MTTPDGGTTESSTGDESPQDTGDTKTTTTTTTTTTETEHIARREAKTILLRLFAPVLIALVVVGAGTTASLYLFWREVNDRRQDECIQAAQDRTDLRLALDLGPLEAIDDILEIFPPDDPNVAAAQEAANEGRRRLDEALPPLDPTEC